MSNIAKENCVGCEQNFYNNFNSIGVRECWNFGKAKLIMRKKVPLNQRPPWKQKASLYPNCYQIRKYWFVSGNRES